MMRAGITRGLALVGGLALAACATGDRPKAAVVVPAVVPYRVTMPVPPARPLVRPAPADLMTAVDLLGRMFDGKVGIAVQSVGDGWTVQSNGDVRLPQQSVAKL